MGERLPIDEVLPELLDAFLARGTAVLRAPTGAGKTTRVAPALLDRIPEGTIVLLEPRRVAARAAAARIAAERGEKLGDTVGYEVRFDRCCGPRTRLVVMTEGILLRRLQSDPFLEGTAAILFDEFHERSLDADLALAMSARVRRDARPDLGLLAMSATLDPGPVAAFLGDAPFIESRGRSFPVDIRWKDTDPRRPLEPAIVGAVGEALAETDGDVLVFLAGVGEIRRARTALESALASRGLDLVELYGDLAPEKQDRALRRGPRRRVLLATNVAETSVTVEGVTAVVDTGLAKVLRYDPALAMDRLVRGRISRSSADQRAGRAGRTAPGLCLRLWSRHEDLSLREREEPELARADLARAVLELRNWGERDVLGFGWLEPPDPAAIARAEETLARLGALDDNGLTAIGRRMVEIPAPPRIARMLLEAEHLGHAEAGARAAAVLAERSSFLGSADAGRHVGSSAWESDVLAALGQLGRGGPGTQHIDRAAAQLRRSLGREPGKAGNPAIAADEAVLRAILAAWPDRVACLRDAASERAVLCGGRGVRLDASSEVRSARLFVCLELDAGRRGTHAEALVRSASAVERAWLDSTRLREEVRTTFDPATERIAARRTTLYEDLVLDETSVRPSAETAEAALLEAALADPERALDLAAEEFGQLRLRLAFLAGVMPELEFPRIDEALLADALRTLCQGRRSFSELRKAPLVDTLAALLGWQTTQALDRLAPTHATIPSGRRVRLVYREEGPPVLAARIQELFGMAEAPCIAEGRARLVVHLLAPNGRPAQVTDDLASFWNSGYAEVRKELRRRYPRHAWPEDPREAPAVRPGRPR